MKQIEYLEASKLFFDQENPRLAEFDVDKEETKILKLLWSEMDIKELVMSILANDFFESEPLYVIPASEGEDKWIVIEGNRRLAAVKAILNPSLLSGMSSFEGRITSGFKKKLASRIPVVKMASREDAWRYIGFKHVKGAAKWDSYAKAKYIAMIHRNFSISLSDIAEQIGDSRRTTMRLYKGLSILEQAEQMTEFRRNDIYYGRIYFSHLYTAIAYEGFSQYIGIAETEDEEVKIPQDHSKQLYQVMLWLFGSEGKKIEPIIRKQNPDLRHLSEVLLKSESVQVLLSTGNLDRAYENSLDSNDVLRSSLVQAKIKVEDALAKVSVYNGEKDAVELSSQLAQASVRLFNALKAVYDDARRSNDDLFNVD